QTLRRIPGQAQCAATPRRNPGTCRAPGHSGGEKRGALTMGIRSSPGFHPYDASNRKTFKSAVCHLLHTEFPGIFGPTITRLFADKIDELYEQFHPPRSRFRLGQVFWAGVAIDDPPSRNKRIEDTRLVPIVLD